MKTKTRRKKTAASRGGTSVIEAEESSSDKVLNEVYKEVAEEKSERPLEDWISVDCPYCGESFEVHVTSEQDGQSLVEDCQVCCRPVGLYFSVEDGEIQAEAYRT